MLIRIKLVDKHGKPKDMAATLGTPTEGHREWTSLHEYMQKVQISPEIIRKMRSKDLSYISGVSSDNKAFNGDEGEARRVKLTQNIKRAEQEIARRYTRTATLLGAFVGASAAMLAVVLSKPHLVDRLKQVFQL